MVDSGATHHMTNEGGMLGNVQKAKIPIMAADNKIISSESQGYLKLQSSDSNVTIRDILHVPNFLKAYCQLHK